MTIEHPLCRVGHLRSIRSQLRLQLELASTLVSNPHVQQLLTAAQDDLSVLPQA